MSGASDTTTSLEPVPPASARSLSSGSTDTARADELSKAVEATAAELEALDAKVTEKQAASDKYFEDNNLSGE